jgi:hypothetical protein
LRRLIKVLAATALMVVLMATTVSPAFAVPPEQWGKNKPEGVTGIGFGADGENDGFACGERNKKGEKVC